MGLDIEYGKRGEMTAICSCRTTLRSEIFTCKTAVLVDEAKLSEFVFSGPKLNQSVTIPLASQPRIAQHLLPLSTRYRGNIPVRRLGF